MNPTPKAHPDMYNGLRGNAFQMRLPLPENGNVRLVLMDWAVMNGTATVLAAADGTASVYLSSGGGFIGGGQRYPEIADAAKEAVQVADTLLPYASKTDKYDVPPEGTVYFYFRTKEAVYLAVADEDRLKSGLDMLSPLGSVMQQVVTGYRLMHGPQMGALD